MKVIVRTHSGIWSSGLFENYSFLLYVIFHNPWTPLSVTMCSLDGIQVKIFWKTLMIEFLVSSFLTDDVWLIFVRYEPYWEESMNKYEWVESMESKIFPERCHTSHRWRGQPWGQSQLQLSGCCCWAWRPSPSCPRASSPPVPWWSSPAVLSRIVKFDRILNAGYILWLITNTE